MKTELKTLRYSNTEQIELEIDLMQKEAEQLTEKRSIWSVITDRNLILPVLLVCALQGGHQLSGVNAVNENDCNLYLQRRVNRLP